MQTRIGALYDEINAFHDSISKWDTIIQKSKEELVVLDQHLSELDANRQRKEELVVGTPSFKPVEQEKEVASIDLGLNNTSQHYIQDLFRKRPSFHFHKHSDVADKKMHVRKKSLNKVDSLEINQNAGTTSKLENVGEKALVLTNFCIPITSPSPFSSSMLGLKGKQLKPYRDIVNILSIDSDARETDVGKDDKFQLDCNQKKNIVVIPAPDRA